MLWLNKFSPTTTVLQQNPVGMSSCMITVKYNVQTDEISEGQCTCKLFWTTKGREKYSQGRHGSAFWPPSWPWWRFLLLTLLLNFSFLAQSKFGKSHRPSPSIASVRKRHFSQHITNENGLRVRGLRISLLSDQLTVLIFFTTVTRVCDNGTCQKRWQRPGRSCSLA